MNVKFPRTGLYPEGVKNKISPDVDIVLTWYLRWAHFMGQTSLSKFLVNMWSLLFQKGTQPGILNFFHFWFFVAFNSTDMAMLWVLKFNLYYRSSPIKLWKRIFDLRSQKIYFGIESWHVRNFSRNGSMGNVKFESEISMKTFVSTKIFYVL